MAYLLTCLLMFVYAFLNSFYFRIVLNRLVSLGVWAFQCFMLSRLILDKLFYLTGVILRCMFVSESLTNNLINTYNESLKK